MKLKIPPVLVMIICIGLMWLIDQVISIGMLEFWWSRFLAHVTFGIGLLVSVLGLWEFYQSSTTIDPHNVQKATALVDSGIYRISRNPMYVGLLCIVISAAFYLDNLITLLTVPLFIIYMNRYQIIPEEEVMEQKFGGNYRRYKSRVHRWL